MSMSSLRILQESAHAQQRGVLSCKLQELGQKGFAKLAVDMHSHRLGPNTKSRLVSRWLCSPGPIGHTDS